MVAVWLLVHTHTHTHTAHQLQRTGGPENNDNNNDHYPYMSALGTVWLRGMEEVDFPQNF